MTILILWAKMCSSCQWAHNCFIYLSNCSFEAICQNQHFNGPTKAWHRFAQKHHTMNSNYPVFSFSISFFCYSLIWLPPISRFKYQRWSFWVIVSWHFSKLNYAKWDRFHHQKFALPADCRNWMRTAETLCRPKG